MDLDENTTRHIKGKFRRYELARRGVEPVGRMGQCSQCGACCAMHIRCQHLVPGTRGTLVCGNYENRPLNCRVFPLDQRDIDDVESSGGSCSFWFTPGSAMEESRWGRLRAMGTRCDGMNATDTASCEECHRRGFTWVIRPDGSMICSEAARFDPDDDGSGSSSVHSGTSLLVGILGFLGTVIVGTRV